jgi:hypothetical protein
MKQNAPDIIAFQEVRYKFEFSGWKTPSIHQMSNLAKLLPEYQYAFTVISLSTSFI